MYWSRKGRVHAATQRTRRNYFILILLDLVKLELEQDGEEVEKRSKGEPLSG